MGDSHQTPAPQTCTAPPELQEVADLVCDGGNAAAVAGMPPQSAGSVGWSTPTLDLMDKASDSPFGLEVVAAPSKPAIFGISGRTQQYTGNGIPLTDEAWGFQNQIDDRKLEMVHNRALLTHLATPGDGAEDLEQLSADELAERVNAARGDQTSEAFFAEMDPEVSNRLQEQMLQTYIKQANDSENAAFILELLPTDANAPPLLGSKDPVTKLPNEFWVGEHVGEMRNSSVTIADQLRQDDDAADVYGLVVPYANTATNVFERDGVPIDGSYNLQNTLGLMDGDVNTVATGYSQGGAAVLDYGPRRGAEDGLDHAVALAPMGGSDRGDLGADGLYSGVLNDVPTLSVTHEEDAAKDVFSDLSISDEALRDEDLLDRVGAFVGAELGYLHGGFDEANPAAGTYGYPTDAVVPLLDSLLDGGFDGQDYARQDDWVYDTNPDKKE